MYLQEILEVAIGLVFMWLILSVSAMTIQEWIGDWFQLRPNDLYKSIQRMLDSKDFQIPIGAGQKKRGGKGLTGKFYNHPMITSLSQPLKNGKLHLPSYIPAKRFAIVLFDLIVQAGTEASPIKKITDDIDKRLDEVMLGLKERESAKAEWGAILETAKQIAASKPSQAAFDSLKAGIKAFGEKYPEAKPALDLDKAMAEVDIFYKDFLEKQRAMGAGLDMPVAVYQLLLGLLTLGAKNDNFGEAITALLRTTEAHLLQGEQAIAQIRTGFESWFNDVQERVSGAYKRRAQWISFAIGVVLALLLNVDSVNVATSLWREPTLRQAIVAQAELYVQENPEGPSTPTDGSTPVPGATISDLQKQMQALKLPFGWATEEFDTGGKQCSLLPVKADQTWGIPSKDTQGAFVCKRITNFPVDLGGWLSKLMGLAITGLATAQGAPFWFDVLKKIINIRSSGANPDEPKPVKK